MVHENQHFAAKVLENKGQRHMYDMSKLKFFFLWYAGHKLIQRGFFRRYLDLGSMVLFLIYKERKYLKTGV